MAGSSNSGKSSKSSSSRGGSSSAKSSGNRGRSERGRSSAPTALFRCEHCKKYYSRKDNLHVHQRIHSGEMPYKCEYCGQQFRWLGAVRSHESNHKRDGDKVGASGSKSARSKGSGKASGSHASGSRQGANRQSSSRHVSANGDYEHSSRGGHGRSSSSRSQRQTDSYSSMSRDRRNDHGSHMSHGTDVFISEEDPGDNWTVSEWPPVLDDEH